MALLLGDEPPSPKSLADKMFNNYAITSDDVEDALRPAYAYTAALIDTPGAEYYFEHRVEFPSVDGAFGTVDLIIRIGNTIHVIDFKFGIGVRVLALYPKEDEDIINAQLLFYAAAARHSLHKFFAGVENIVLTILQPVSTEADAEMVSTVAVTHGELDQFVVAYRAACTEALDKSPRLERGSWCRFCPARPICPAHTAPLLDLARLTLPTASTPNYLQVLADGLNLVNTIKDIQTALHDQAKLALENGDIVAGYGLSAGRAERHWRDENLAVTALERLGLGHDDIIAQAMRSPKQVEIRAKARGLKVPQELISLHRSGVSLVRCENAHAPVPGRDEIVRSFSAAIEAFQGGRQS
jgi:hypothetical protein